MTASERNWFVRRDDRQVGPLEFEQLQELARRGELQVTDLIGNPARKTWIAVQRMPTLLRLISAAPKDAAGPDNPFAQTGLFASASRFETENPSEATTLSGATGAVEPTSFSETPRAFETREVSEPEPPSEPPNPFASVTTTAANPDEGSPVEENPVAENSAAAVFVAPENLVLTESTIAAEGIVASDGSAASGAAAPDDAARSDDSEPSLPDVSAMPLLRRLLPDVPDSKAALIPPSLPEPLPKPPEKPSAKMVVPTIRDLGAFAELHDPESEQVPRRNFVARHWRGELPFSVSFWRNGVAGLLVLSIAAVLVSVGPVFEDDIAPTLLLTVFVAIWLIILAVSIWLMVGVWRSADSNQQQSEPGSRAGFWSLLAKLTVAAGALHMLFVFGTAGIARCRDYLQIRAQDATMRKPTFQVTRDGRALEFSGGISLGLAKELAQWLSPPRSVQTIVINSDGGRVREADRIAALIASREIDTYVTDRCLSACASVFLAGRNRLIAPAAKLGFHQPDFPGWTAEQRVGAGAGLEARLRRLGTSATFAQRAGSTPPGDLWYPSATELLAEKVVTRVVAPSDYTFPESNLFGPAPRGLVLPR